MLIFPRLAFAEIELQSSKSWKDGVYAWFYNPNHSPDWLAADEAEDLFRLSAKKWEQCGVEIVYMGLTTVQPGKMDGVNVVGWSTKLPRKVRGVTVGRSRGRELIEKDVLIRPDRLEFKRSQQLLTKVVTHELGHAIGMSHSSRCDDVMTLAADCPRADPKTLPISPTNNDLERCNSLYATQNN
jgi:hypothetical protein